MAFEPSSSKQGSPARSGPDTLVTDLDGTVLFDRQIAAADSAALRRWRQSGRRLVLCTGKSLSATREVWDPTQIGADAVVAFTGGAVTDGEFAPVWTGNLDVGIVAELATALREEPIALLASDLAADYLVLDRVGIDSPILPSLVPISLAEVGTRSVFGIPVNVPRPQDRGRILQLVRGLVQGRAEVYPNLDFIDVVPPGASKGTGLARYLETAGPVGRLITIGDSYNDLPMHRLADQSYALEHSPPEVASVTDGVVGSVAELITHLLETELESQ